MSGSKLQNFSLISGLCCCALRPTSVEIPISKLSVVGKGISIFRAESASSGWMWTQKSVKLLFSLKVIFIVPSDAISTKLSTCLGGSLELTCSIWVFTRNGFLIHSRQCLILGNMFPIVSEGITDVPWRLCRHSAPLWQRWENPRASGNYSWWLRRGHHSSILRCANRRWRLKISARYANFVSHWKSCTLSYCSSVWGITRHAEFHNFATELLGVAEVLASCQYTFCVRGFTWFSFDSVLSHTVKKN